MKLSDEELDAMARHGDGIVRGVRTTADVSGIRAVKSKLRRVSHHLESGKKGRDALHDLWKAMSFLDDSFTVGFLRLVKRKPKDGSA